MLLLFPAIYLAIAVHEAGHIVAGKLAGLGCGGMWVGGFMVYKTGGRWKLRFDGRQVRAAGLVLPRATKNDLRIASFGWFIAGGPMATLLLASVSALGFLRFGGGILNWIGSVFWGAMLLLASLIPYPRYSDTARLWQLFRERERLREWMALIALLTEEARGVSPRNWDPGLTVKVLNIRPCDALYPLAQLFACYRAYDCGDRNAALKNLENALSAASRFGTEKMRQWCFLEAASACASERNNPAHARVWLERAKKIEEPEPLAGIEAEIAACEGRYPDALRLWHEAREFIAGKGMDSGLARFALEKIAEGESECLSRLDQAVLATGTPVLLARPPIPQTEKLGSFPWISVAAVASLIIIILLAAMLGYFGR